MAAKCSRWDLNSGLHSRRMRGWGGVEGGATDPMELREKKVFA